MEQIIKKLESAYTDCVSKTAELNEKDSQLRLREARLAEKEKTLNAQDSSLKSREAEVKKVEDPLKLLDQIKVAKRDLATATADFDNQKQAFLEYEAKIRKEIASAKVSIKGDKELVTKELDVLKKDRAKLEEEKKNYKDQILKKLSAGVK